MVNIYILRSATLGRPPSYYQQTMQSRRMIGYQSPLLSLVVHVVPYVGGTDDRDTLCVLVPLTL